VSVSAAGEIAEEGADPRAQDRLGGAVGAFAGRESASACLDDPEQRQFPLWRSRRGAPASPQLRFVGAMAGPRVCCPTGAR